MRNALFLQALQSSSERPPVWLMRQAGRYMPDYQALRRKHGLKELFCSPELAAEITLLPEKLLGVDASILFSDILTVCDVLGVDWDFVEGRGPIIAGGRGIAPGFAFAKRPADLALAYVGETIEKLKGKCTTPLIGFCGGPFTLASYFIAGGSDKDLRATWHWMRNAPEQFKALLTTLADAAAASLCVQIQAGVDAVQIFDSWSGLLPPRQFSTFVIKALEHLLGQLPEDIPVIYFCRGGARHIAALSRLKVAALSLDWKSDLPSVRKETDMVLQGNLDPSILLQGKETIAAAAAKILESMQGDKGFIFNLGHGVLPSTPFENVRFLVDYVRGYHVRNTCQRNEPAGASLYELSDGSGI